MNYGTYCADLVQKMESKMVTGQQPYKMSAKMMSGNNKRMLFLNTKMYIL